MPLGRPKRGVAIKYDKAQEKKLAELERLILERAAERRLLMAKSKAQRHAETGAWLARQMGASDDK